MHEIIRRLRARRSATGSVRRQRPWLQNCDDGGGSVTASIADLGPSASARIKGGIGAIALLAAVLLMAACGWATSAQAGTFGEIAHIGEFGTALGDFTYPSAIAVDVEEGDSVFVLDAPGAERGGFGPSKFRIQKFHSISGALTALPEASVEVATPPDAEGFSSWVAGIAVDQSLKRLYVLKATKTWEGGHNEYVAQQIDAYSTSEVGLKGELKPAPHVETNGKAGVYYEFPVTVATDSQPPTNMLREPAGITVEPTTHAIVIDGCDEKGLTEIQRISAEGTESNKGKFGEAFDDTSKELTPGAPAVTGVVAAPAEEGTLYVVGKYIKNSKGGGTPGVAELTTTGGHTLAKPAIKTIRSQENQSETPRVTGGLGATPGRESGAQIGISPEGNVLYVGEMSEAGGGTNNPAGSYEVLGLSATTGTTQAVFGGGTSSCRISSERNAIAVGASGTVFALDEGSPITTSSPTKPSSYGFHLIEFGAGGSGCPTPATAIDESVPVGPIKAEKGAEVKFEASTAGLHKEEPTKLVWSVKGPETFSEPVTGTPAALSMAHRFLKTGDYTVELEMEVSPGSYGQPATVTRTMEVTAPPPQASFEASTMSPASGEAVSFNAKESLDPRGECSKTGCGPTHALESYVWNFGDGTEVTTATPEVVHSFANSAEQPLSDTVKLTVVNEENVPSGATEETLAIQGVAVKVTTTSSTTSSTATIARTMSTSTTTNTTTTKTTSKPKIESKQKKLAKALKLCKKDKSKRKRLACEKRAKKKYGSKPKHKKKK